MSGDAVTSESGRVCPTCKQSDQVEDSVDAEKWEGYCYRCMTPFDGPFVGFQRVQKREVRGDAAEKP